MDDKLPVEEENRASARILPFPAPEKPAAAKEVASDEVDAGSFGYLRSPGDRALFIEFRLLAGNPYSVGSLALNYSMRGCCDCWHDAKGFELDFMDGYRITVTGQGLRHIYERILQNRVLWLQEEGRDAIAGQADPEAPRIYAINVERRAEGAE